MSWFSDVWDKGVSTFGKVMESTVGDLSIAGNLSKAITGTNQISDFYQKQFVDKSALRGAEIETFLSGLPGVGGVVKGLDGIQQLEDLYDRTGKIPAYPGLQTPGASGIGKSLGGVARKIEDGVHDLADYYAGEKVGMPIEGKDYVTGDNYVNQ